MRQFPHSQELDALLHAQRIEPAELATFGTDLAHIHETLPVARAGQAWGEPGAQIAGIKHNAAECVRAGAAFGDTAGLRDIQVRLGA